MILCSYIKLTNNLKKKTEKCKEQDYILPRKSCLRLFYRMRSLKVSFASWTWNHWWSVAVNKAPLCTNGWKPFWVWENTWLWDDPIRRKKSPLVQCQHRRETEQWMMVASMNKPIVTVQHVSTMKLHIQLP